MREITQLLWESTGESWCINYSGSYILIESMFCTMWSLVCSFVFMPEFQLGCLTFWSGLFYNGVVLKASFFFFFLQTATQAEEVRFITIHILVSPEKLLLPLDGPTVCRWLKTDIREPFSCPPGWEGFPLYLIGTGNIFIESNSAPVVSLCMIILCHVIIYCTERWILSFACKNYWKLVVMLTKSTVFQSIRLLLFLLNIFSKENCNLIFHSFCILFLPLKECYLKTSCGAVSEVLV